MSRIGKKPVSLPQGVSATVSGQTVTAKGPKGELNFVVNDEVLVKMDNNQIAVEPRDETRAPAPNGACRARRSSTSSKA